MLRSPLMNVMTAAALKAGKSLRRDFLELPSLTISRKGPGDFVTEADKKSERILFQELSKARPGYGFLMEEGGTFEGTDKTHRFIIDPLDGTTNFLHAIPQFAISIGLEREDEIIAALVYNPVTEEMFVAEKGAGAFVQGSSIELSADGPIREPYAVYFQGGLTWYHAKLGILMSLQQLVGGGFVKLPQ